MADCSLSALLSQVLVAFTIEFDNEFEDLIAHRTTRAGATATSRRDPWLVSMAMWSTCMRFVDDDGVRVGELEDLARTPTNLDGMRRWGYIVIERDPADGATKARRSDRMIRATPKGREARAIWQPLGGVIEARWRTRWGESEVEQLCESLRSVVAGLDDGLPDCLPILGYGLWSKPRENARRRPATRAGAIASTLALPALASRVLLAFVIEFEHESPLSLAISANVVRALDDSGARVRDLPRATGVSKEAISMALGVLRKRGLAVVEPDPNVSRTKIVRLTPAGRAAQRAGDELLAEIEARWRARHGSDRILALRGSLERLVADPTASPLLDGTRPYPDGWRASTPAPRTLPHYPMILHRGGFPDGS
jgi:DNA-binding MarR family transcriptional regulator